MSLFMRQPMPTAAEGHTRAHTSLTAASHGQLYRHGLKRVLDIVLVLLTAVPALIVVLFCALLVALDGKSPFYTQLRVGRDGRTFRMLKLRSMVPDADALLAKHLQDDPAARAEWAHSQKLRNDPRITWIGRIIRKSSLDELPQLWNVLIGDMSLVGPRPMLPCQTGMYPGMAYYALRPGLTGFWQISVRHESSFTERARYDTAYLWELSLRTDIGVMLRTVQVVLRGTGC
ncbi:sugar transferase [Ponticoccus sp. (in: a-proteobacteria)]|uniref:sugar transferase n=1 Tax=Ponticoccus sp. (in: a-proteobacteria) TaxID=1925025 RepID=UPI003AB71C5A